MRIHIALDDELVAEFDQRAGTRQRSAFVAELIRRGLEDERRWDDIESALGSVPDSGHEWDDGGCVGRDRVIGGVQVDDGSSAMFRPQMWPQVRQGPSVVPAPTPLEPKGFAITFPAA